jgi:hypothetical protein
MGTNGEIIAEGKGVNGRKVQRNSLKQAIELALANDITEIPIPVIDVPANYKIDAEVQKMGIKERISQGAHLLLRLANKPPAQHKNRRDQI